MTMKKETAHKIRREDALAIVDGIAGAGQGIQAIASALPFAVLETYVFIKVREPIAPNDTAADLLKDRLIRLTRPFTIILGIMYQGALGGIATAVADAINDLLAGFSAQRVLKKNPKDEPFPGWGFYYQVSVIDALWVASFLPLLLLTLRAQGVEKATAII